MARLCSICVRGGSKGVKDKNIRQLLGKPLVAHSIEQARKSGLFDYVVVSSDSEVILDIAQQWGADLTIRRPEHLAGDHSAKLPAIRHCLLEAERMLNIEFDIVVDLDATSPLRTVDDIAASVELLEKHDISNVITGAPSRRSPYFNLVEQNEKGIVSLSKTLDVPVVRRQDAPKCYDMNASIYVWKRKILLEEENLFQHDTMIYVMPEERSVDIDSELDFRIVEWIMKDREGVSDE